MVPLATPCVCKPFTSSPQTTHTDRSRRPLVPGHSKHSGRRAEGVAAACLDAGICVIQAYEATLRNPRLPAPSPCPTPPSSRYLRRPVTSSPSVCYSLLAPDSLSGTVCPTLMKCLSRPPQRTILWERQDQQNNTVHCMLKLLTEPTLQARCRPSSGDPDP